MSAKWRHVRMSFTLGRKRQPMVTGKTLQPIVDLRRSIDKQKACTRFAPASSARCSGQRGSKSKEEDSCRIKECQGKNNPDEDGFYPDVPV